MEKITNLDEYKKKKEELVMDEICEFQLDYSDEVVPSEIHLSSAGIKAVFFEADVSRFRTSMILNGESFLDTFYRYKSPYFEPFKLTLYGVRYSKGKMKEGKQVSLAAAEGILIDTGDEVEHFTLADALHKRSSLLDPIADIITAEDGMTNFGVCGENGFPLIIEKFGVTKDYRGLGVGRFFLTNFREVLSWSWNVDIRMIFTTPCRVAVTEENGTVRLEHPDDVRSETTAKEMRGIAQFLIKSGYSKIPGTNVFALGGHE